MINLLILITSSSLQCEEKFDVGHSWILKELKLQRKIVWIFWGAYYTAHSQQQISSAKSRRCTSLWHKASNRTRYVAAPPSRSCHFFNIASALSEYSGHCRPFLWIPSSTASLIFSRRPRASQWRGSSFARVSRSSSDTGPSLTKRYQIQNGRCMCILIYAINQSINQSIPVCYLRSTFYWNRAKNKSSQQTLIGFWRRAPLAYLYPNFKYRRMAYLRISNKRFSKRSQKGQNLIYNSSNTQLKHKKYSPLSAWLESELEEGSVRALFDGPAEGWAGAPVKRNKASRQYSTRKLTQKSFSRPQFSRPVNGSNEAFCY